MRRVILLILLLFTAGWAASSPWTYLTPDRDFEVTLPFNNASDVSSFSFDGNKRTGFFVDSIVSKQLFGEADCLNVREFGVWSEPYRDETKFKKFVLTKFGDPGKPGQRGAAKETSVQLGSLTGFQLDRDYSGYQGKRTLERVVGVHTQTWQHSFYCMWHQNPNEPQVMKFFASIRSTRP